MSFSSLKSYFISKKLVFLSVIAMTFIILIVPNVAKAVDFSLPDGDFFNNTVSGGPPNHNVNLIISQPGTGVKLDAQETWGKIFYDPALTSTLGVQIFDGDFSDCGGNHVDAQGAGDAPCSGPNEVRYDFYYGALPDGSNREGAPIAGQSKDGSFFPNNGWRNFDIPLPPSGPLNTGAGSRYVIYVRATWTNAGPAAGRINGFKIASSSTGGLASYWAFPGVTAPGKPSSVAAYALQDRVSPTASEGQFKFEFAAPCSAPDTQTVTIKWNDADAHNLGGSPPDGAQPGFPGDTPIRFDLYENGAKILSADGGGAQNAVGAPAGVWPENNIGGDSDYREVPITIHKARKYEWVWSNVNRFNGVQLWMPYDSFYYSVDCSTLGTPPPPAITPCPNGDTGVSHVRIAWNSADNPAGTSGYIVDLDDDNWAGGHWNKGSGGLTSVIGPEGFNFYPPPGGSLTFTPGNTYYARVFYQGPNRHSRTTTFTAPSCSGSASPTISGHVYDSSGSGVGGIVVRVYNSSGSVVGTPTSNSSGFWSFGGLSSNQGFALRADGTACADWSNFQATNNRPGIPNNGCGNTHTYEHQIADRDCQFTLCLGPEGSHDLASDTTYDFRAPGGAGIPPISAGPFCSGSTSKFTVNWSEAGRGSDGYWVDISPDSSFSNINNKFVSSGTTSTDGLNGFGGHAGFPKIVNLTPGNTYYLRIWYIAASEHSPSTSFSAEDCGAPVPPEPELIPTCTIGEPTVTIRWNDIAGLSPSGFTIDFDDSSRFAGGYLYFDYSGPLSGPYEVRDAPNGFRNFGPSPPTLPLASATTYYVRINYRNASSGSDVHSVTGSFVTKDDCVPVPNIVCNDINPRKIELGSGVFDMTVSFRNGEVIDPHQDYMGGNGNLIIDGDSHPLTPFPDPVKGDGTIYTVTVSGLTPPSNTGEYPVKLTFSGGSPATPVDADCGLFKVIRKPYLRAYGGDVLTGTSFMDSGSCSIIPGARILAFNARGGPDYRGAGVQLASFALGTIVEFASAQSRPTTPVAPRGLSFSNTTGPLFGGQWHENNMHNLCAEDYFSLLPPPAVISSLSTVNYHTTDTDFDLKRIGVGKKHVEFVDGNVTISKGILYDKPPGGYNKPDDIPSYVLIVRGDIFIKHKVEQLDGIFIAQPDAAGNRGRIFTCARDFVLAGDDNLVNQCGERKLTVNGALIARSVVPLRTLGTVISGSQSELYSSGNIAESIIYSPEVWLRKLTPNGFFGSPSDITSPPKYDAITALPPIF